MTAWEWPQTRITRVIDGDTIDALVRRDLGFGGWVQFPIRLRLNRINAPKLSTANGKKARDRVLELTQDTLLDVATVAAYKYGGPDDETGEWMAEVTLPGGSNLSDVLLSEGLVVKWDGNGPRPNDG